MRRIAVIGMLLALATTAVADAHSEKHKPTGRIAHGRFARNGGLHGEWLIIVRRGRHGSRLAAGEGMFSGEVTPKGRFTVQLPVGTFTLGGWREHPGVLAGRLCGVTTLTVRRNKPIPFIRINCKTEA
jgi:hypothetical protein